MKRRIAIIFAFLVFGLVVFSVARNDYDGISQWGANMIARLTMGYNDTYFMNASSANASSPNTFLNCRAISTDSTGIVKIAYLTDFNDTTKEVKVLNGGQIYPVRNVVLLYRYYTGTTAGTAYSYTNGGVLTANSIKLHR